MMTPPSQGVSDTNWSRPMNAMTYIGFSARIEFDGADGIFFGIIAGIRDRISFHGATVKDLTGAFHEAVDDYIETCAKIGKKPLKPYSGKLMLRVIPPEIKGV